MRCHHSLNWRHFVIWLHSIYKQSISIIQGNERSEDCNNLHPKPIYFCRSGCVYNTSLCKKISGLNQSEIRVILYTEFQRNNTAPRPDDISLNFLNINKTNFYSPLYRSLVPDHINNLRGAHIISGVILDILTKISGEKELASEMKTHALITSLNNIIDGLEKNKGFNFPYRCEISGNINSISVSSSFLIDDFLHNHKMIYIKTSKITNLSINFLSVFLNRSR